MPAVDRLPIGPSPLTTRIRLTGVEPDTGHGIRVSSHGRMDPENPIFAGHYPGLPIFPGVFLVECLHQTVLGAARYHGVLTVLDAVVKARFVNPVFPGEEIDIRAVITAGAQQWSASAVLYGAQAQVAGIDLRYLLLGGVP